MEERGLFPLGLVLFPGEQIPLHIFEPRYKELIGESLGSGEPFGIVLSEDDGVREVGTLATVTDVLERFPDGRLNVLVEGIERFKIAALTEGRSFATARVDPYDDQPEDAAPSEIERCMNAFRSLLEAADADDAEEELPEPDAGDISFQIAAR